MRRLICAFVVCICHKTGFLVTWLIYKCAGKIEFNMSRDMTKPTKWVCTQRRLRSAWASAQADQSLHCRMKKPSVLSYPLSAQRRLWSDWADAQADLSLRWAHTHFVGFVMSWLVYFRQQQSSRSKCHLLCIAIDIKWLKICDKSRGTSVPISLDIGTLTWYWHAYLDAFACCHCMTML